jgi:hypothetical protein
MKHYRGFDIDWDTDGEDVDLPSEVEFELDNDLDPSIDGANAISDKIGWCINSCNFDLVSTSSKRYVIYGAEESKFEDQPMYWNNEMGWVDLHNADIIHHDEKDLNNLPLGGEWVEVTITAGVNNG